MKLEESSLTTKFASQTCQLHILQIAVEAALKPRCFDEHKLAKLQSINDLILMLHDTVTPYYMKVCLSPFQPFSTDSDFRGSRDTTSPSLGSLGSGWHSAMRALNMPLQVSLRCKALSTSAFERIGATQRICMFQ